MITVVKEIMTKRLIYINKGASLKEAYSLMTKNKIRHLPVKDENNKIAGVITRRELLSSPHVDDIPVEFIMNSSVDYIDQDITLSTAIQRMLELKVTSLLITDPSKNPIGIITTDDLLAYMAHILSESKDQDHPIFSLMNLQTIGKVAESLSTIGI